jgi:hypothetical protein
VHMRAWPTAANVEGMCDAHGKDATLLSINKLCLELIEHSGSSIG